MPSTSDILIKFKGKLSCPDISDDTKIKVLSSLSHFTITAADLGESGIGRVVAKLKSSSNSSLSSAARSLVNTWKDLVEKEVLKSKSDSLSANCTNDHTNSYNHSCQTTHSDVTKKSTNSSKNHSSQSEKTIEDKKKYRDSDTPKSQRETESSKSHKISDSKFSNRSIFDQFLTFNSDKNGESSHSKDNEFSQNETSNKQSSREVTDAITSQPKPSTSKSAAIQSGSEDAAELGGLDSTSGISFADCLGGFNANNSKNKKRKIKSPTDLSKKRKSDSALLKIPTKLKKLELTREDILSDVAESVKDRVQPVPIVKNTQKKLDDGASGSLKITTGIQIYKGKSRMARDGNQIIPPLEQLCIRVLIQNIHLLDHVGGVPYMILQPVLEVCSPEQLERLEKYNPIFLEDSDELWQKHVDRKYRGAVRPKPGQTWRQLYLRKKTEEEEKFNKLTKSLASSMQSSNEKRRTIGWIADAKPPRDVRKRQERYKTGHIQAAASDPLVKLGGHTRQFPQPKLAAYTPSKHFEEAPSTSRSGDEKKKFIKSSKNAPLMKKLVRQIKKDNFRPYC